MINMERLYWISCVKDFVKSVRKEVGIPDEALEAIEDAQKMFAIILTEEASDQNERRLLS